MKITEQRVKTITSIILDTADFANMIEYYKRNELFKTMYPDAFKDMTVTAEMPEKNVIKVMEEMKILGNKDTYNFIADYHSFDGWENSGYYDEKKKIYKMVVYSNGDTMNI